MGGGIGIPIKLMYEAVGHVVTVELQTGEVYRGRLLSTEDNWNCQLQEVMATGRDGHVSQLEQVYLRGSKVRFMILPDMLANAPMFQKAAAKAVAARGRHGLLRAQGTSGAVRAAGVVGRHGWPADALPPPAARTATGWRSASVRGAAWPGREARVGAAPHGAQGPRAGTLDSPVQHVGRLRRARRAALLRPAPAPVPAGRPADPCARRRSYAVLPSSCIGRPCSAVM